MDVLNDVLELMHGARGRFSTLEMEIACVRRPRAISIGVSRWTGNPREPGADAIVQTREHLWLNADLRWRLRMDGSDSFGATEYVDDGRGLWGRDARKGWTSFGNGSGGDLWAARCHQLLWDPNVLIPELWLEPLDRVDVAGRPGIRVRGTKRETTHDYIVADPWADELELVVDAGAGVLLRMASLVDDEEAAVEEVLDVRIDHELAEDLFGVV